MDSTPAIDHQFYVLECELNEELAKLELPKEISCVYNPVQYASALHWAYLKKYLGGTKNVVFIGINPGPKGMCQTGVSNIYLRNM